MGLSDFANFGEAIGGFAVVFSLLYLAYELRTSTKTLKASTAAQAGQSWASLNESLIHDPELIELTNTLFSREYQSETLSKVELSRIRLFCRTIMQKVESEYFLFAAGILPENVWETHRSNIRRWFELPGWKEWWEQEVKYSGYTEEFLENLFPSDREPSVGES